jgi:ubiquinone/menaquinone biosynthesis C-methylase UbiE
MIARFYNARYSIEQCKKYDVVLSSLKTIKNNFILDVGCGTGLFIKKIATVGNIVIGIDISKRMLQKAKRDCRDLINVSLICGDADYLPIKENLIHFVFVFTLLQNMPDPERTIIEIIRIANVKSVIVITAQKKAFTKEVFEQLLEKVGLNVSNCCNSEDLKDHVAICTKHI